MSILSHPHFHNESAARERLEAIVWPKGPYCPKCGGFDRITPVKGGRPGLRRCGPCKREFTVTVGTIFERSKVALHKWFQAAHLMASSKKGISAHQLHRTLGVTYKTAWFMEHRLREAMRELNPTTPLGGEGKTVEVDETYVGGKEKNKHKHKHKHKRRPPGTLYDFTTPRDEIGMLEGRLQEVGTHYNSASVRIELRGRNLVWCRLSSELQKDFEDKTTFNDVWRHRRVHVHGRIKYDVDGDIDYVMADDILRIEDKEIPLDTIRDPGFTGSLSIGEYLDRFREGMLG